MLKKINKEAEYLKQKSQGFKHATEVEKNIALFKHTKMQIPLLTNCVEALEKSNRAMADEEVKNGAEFLLLAEKTIDNPILSNYMKIFGDTLKIIGQHHLQLSQLFKEVRCDLEGIKNQHFKTIGDQKKVTNRAISDATYYRSHNKEKRAEEAESKYKELSTELSAMVQTLKTKVNQQLPESVNRLQKGYISYLRRSLEDAENGDQSMSSVLLFGPSEPVAPSKSPGISSTSPRSPRRRLSSTPAQPVTGTLRTSGNYNNSGTSGTNHVNGTGYPPGPGHLNNHRSNSFTQQGHGAAQSSSAQTSSHNSYNPLNYTPTLANPNAIFSPPSPTSVPPLSYLPGRSESPPLQTNVKSRNSSVTTSPTHLSPQTSPRASVAPSRPKSSNYLQALALYDFTATEPSELSFVKGDVLTLLNAKGSWWLAELKGNRGEIPGNYIQLLS
jgi:hypothetical protein